MPAFNQSIAQTSTGNVTDTTIETEVDFDVLIKRQEKLEKELANLREMYHDMKDHNALQIDRVERRIDKLEEELIELRKTLDTFNISLGLIETGVNNVKQTVSDINAKQDTTITAQDKFISQLWKAFFALLTIITAGGSALIAIFK